MNETFWSRDITNVPVLAYFKLKMNLNLNFMCKIVLNIFKDILWNKCPQKIKQETKLDYVKMT